MTLLKKKRWEKSSSDGFTVVEVALITIIAGILFAGFLSVYKSYSVGKSEKLTLERMTRAQNSLREFLGLYGRYPFPADPTLAPGDAGYGVEQCWDGVSACPAGLVCTNMATRDARGDGTTDFIVIGSLPAVTMVDQKELARFEVVDSLDAYNMKITYAVSQNLADCTATIVDPANVQMGAIPLKDENNRDVVDPPDSAHYVLISHGEDSRGAYSVLGNFIGDCTLIDIFTGSPLAPGNNLGGGLEQVQLENCDRDDGVFVSGLRTVAAGAAYFDDIVFFGADADNVLWRRAISAGCTGMTCLYNTNWGNVGVGTLTPAFKLDVNGNIRVEDRVRADAGYCDWSGDDCVAAENFGGTAMPACPAGLVATGIENNHVVCGNVFSAPITVPDCPSGEYLRGFSNLGNAICEAP